LDETFDIDGVSEEHMEKARSYFADYKDTIQVKTLTLFAFKLFAFSEFA
jgi:hypothetical protein